MEVDASIETRSHAANSVACLVSVWPAAFVGHPAVANFMTAHYEYVIAPTEFDGRKSRMRRIEVEARSDTANHDSGTVVIFLEGLASLDESASFFLRPLDAIAREMDLGTLADKQRAVDVRPVAGGIELVIGADVASHAALTPGSAVEIELPDAGVWSEFSWPMMKRPPRARLMKVTAARGQSAPASDPASLQSAGQSSAANPPPREEGGLMAEAHLSREPEFREAASANEPRSLPGQEYVVFYPHARGGKLGSSADRSDPTKRPAKSLLPSSRLGIAVLTAVAVLGAQGAIWIGNGGNSLPRPTGGPASIAAPGAPGEASLYELFAVGSVSPRGVQGSGVATGKALENAQAALLTPGAPRDSEEGAYWLRRFITSGGSDERTRRVLTQLGTAFADGTTRAPDYGRARQIWELASAFGDPVAMCFLGSLHESGLGVTVDRKIALQWFERAKLAGGCPSVDVSIARVKK